jgi:hypothetical protein
LGGGAIAGRGSVDFVVLDICATLSVIPCGDAFRIDVGVFACVCTVHKCNKSQRKPKCLRSCSIRVSLGIGHTTDHNADTRSTPQVSRTRRDSTPSPSTVTDSHAPVATVGSRRTRARLHDLSTTGDSPTGGAAGGGSSHPVNCPLSVVSTFASRIRIRNSCSFGIRARPVPKGTRPSRHGIQQFKLYFKLVTSCSSSAE